MSPVSRGRKTKRARQTPPTPGAPPSVRDLHRDMVAGFGETLATDDALAVELLASSMAGSWWYALRDRDDPDADFGLGLVEYARQRQTAQALALLRALQAVGVSDQLRSAAAAAADELAAAGVAEPPWAHSIGRVEVGQCWRLADVYGDQASLLCLFDEGGQRHCLVTVVEFNDEDAWVRDAFVTADTDEVLATMRADVADSGGMLRLDPIEPAQARRLIESGFAAVDRTVVLYERELGESFHDTRAVALARCRAMPAPTEPPAEVSEVSEVSEDERDGIVAEFLASRHGRELPDAEAARYCARLLVDFGADCDAGGPLRISPIKIERLFDEWLPHEVTLDEEDVAGAPAVIAAWVRWTAERNSLPAAALTELLEVARECGARFAEEHASDDLDFDALAPR